MKNKKHTLIFGFIILFLISMTMISGIFAKYITNINTSNVIKPNSFYFNTNYEDDGTYELYSDEITITVSNSYLGNTTEEDINYSVIVKEGENIIATVSGILTQSNGFKEHVLQVEYNKEYKVVIQTTTPFKKTIEHNFITYYSSVDGYYTLTDMGGWIELDLYIGSYVPNSIIINYISALSADNTNPLTTGWYGTQGTISKSLITNNAHYKIIFFKNDSYSYEKVTNGSFTASGLDYSVTITK